jgi:hypothetical protein
VIGSRERPAVLRVQSQRRVYEVLYFCQVHGIQATVGIEPDRPEDLSDLERAVQALHDSAITIA